VEHRVKLFAYEKDPDAFDNQRRLAKAPTPAVRQQIIAGRVRHLKRELWAFEDQISNILKES
jgi:hypothetical protein